MLNLECGQSSVQNQAFFCGKREATGSAMGTQSDCLYHADSLPQVHRTSAASLRAEAGAVDVDAILMQSSRYYFSYMKRFSGDVSYW